jgi:dihydroflavonol-4-reductase
MTCLVTGANGFLGSAVVRALLESGHGVAALVRSGSDQTNLAGLEVSVRHGDLRDRAALEQAMSGCRAVFHVAADYRLWARHPGEMYETNVDGSRNVVEAAASQGVDRLVYTSSVAVLGINADRSPADEDTPVTLDDMIGHYKRSKYLAEAAVHTAAARVGLSYVVTNPSTPIGPGDIRPTPTGRIIVDAATGKIPAFVDTGLNVVHVDDVARGHLLALERGEDGERYILGGEDLSLQEILRIVAQRLDRRPPNIRLPRRPLYPIAAVAELLARFTGAEPRITIDGLRMAAKHMYFSSDKAARVLGYAARPAAMAIHDALDWFRAHSYI